jgi:hypothetical protein
MAEPYTTDRRLRNDPGVRVWRPVDPALIAFD